MPTLPLNLFSDLPASRPEPIEGCTNADVDAVERNLMLISASCNDPISPSNVGSAPSAASLMLADMAIEYPTPDDAQVVMIERAIELPREAAPMRFDVPTESVVNFNSAINFDSHSTEMLPSSLSRYEPIGDILARENEAEAIKLWNNGGSARFIPTACERAFGEQWAHDVAAAGAARAKGG